jgi:hypothetical protein
MAVLLVMEPSLLDLFFRFCFSEPVTESQKETRPQLMAYCVLDAKQDFMIHHNCANPFVSSFRSHFWILASEFLCAVF